MSETTREYLARMLQNQQDENVDESLSIPPINPEKVLTKENLLKDKGFMDDVHNFLSQRVGENFGSDEAAYNRYLEHMRAGINSVVMWGDWKYASDSNRTDQEKIAMAKLYQTHDVLAKQRKWYQASDQKLGLVGKTWDYLAPSLWDPTNVAAVFTGGTGKVAAEAAKQGVKWNLRKYLSSALKRGLVGGTIEGAGGAAHGAFTELARKEVGLEADVKRGTITGAVVGFGAGTVLGAGAAHMANRSAYRATSKIKLGQEAAKEQSDAFRVEATKIAEEKIADPKNKTNATVAANFVKRRRALEKDHIERGNLIIEDSTVHRLEPDEIKRIVAATSDVLKIADKLVLDETLLPDGTKLIDKFTDAELRKTAKIHYAIKSGLIPEERLRDLASKFDIDVHDLGYVLTAEASAAGRTLQALSNTIEGLDMDPAVAKKIVDEIILGVENLPLQKTVQTTIADASVEAVGKLGGTTWNFMMNLSKARLGILTSAIGTTMRNIENITLRVPMFMLEYTLMGGGKGSTVGTRFVDALKVPYGIFNSGDAQALRLFWADTGKMKRDPVKWAEAKSKIRKRLKLKKTQQLTEEQENIARKYYTKELGGKEITESGELAQRIFRQNADVEAATGRFSFLGNLGRKLNFVNTLVDNSVKSGLFLAEMRRVAGGSAALNSILSGTGRTTVGDKTIPLTFDRWARDNSKEVEGAMQNVLETVYQGDFKKGTFGEKFIRHTATGPYMPITSMFIPFARFLANSIEFQYKHAPLLGLVGRGSWRKFDYQTGAAVRGRGFVGQAQSKWKQFRGADLSVEQALEVKDFNKNMAQQISGAGLLYGALYWKASQGPDIAWNEARIGGKTYDITAWLGPFAVTAFGADLAYRAMEGNLGHITPTYKEPLDTNFDKLITPSIIKNALLVVAGYRGRGIAQPLNAFEQLVFGIASFDGDLDSPEAIKEEKINKFATEMAANYFASFTTPLTMFRDAGAAFDPAGRVIMDNDRVNIIEHFYNVALRNLPNTEAMRNFEKYLGITDGTPMASWLARTRSSTLKPWARLTRTGREQIADIEVKKQLPSQASTHEGPVTRSTDIVRQLGFSSNYPNGIKPPLDLLLTRMGRTRSQWHGRKIKDPIIWNAYKDLLDSKAEELLAYMYQDSVYVGSDWATRRDLLFNPQSGKIIELRRETKKVVEQAADRSIPDRMDRVRYMRLPETRRVVLQKWYEDTFDESFSDWTRFSKTRNLNVFKLMMARNKEIQEVQGNR